MSTRVVLVTAAANGIGEATASSFADEGDRVMLVDLDAPALDAVASRLRDGSASVETVVADVTEERATTAAVAATVDAFGQIDVLVNVVGGSRPGQTVIELSVEEWNRLLALNLTSTFLMCKAAVGPMEQAGGGVIVNVSSGAGVHGMPRNPAYVAAKAGVAALTRALAIDHGPNGVRVNCVAPGPVLTPLMRRNRSPEEIERFGRSTLVGHVAEPAEVARVIVWLASDGASYVMGQTISVDGGGIGAR